ncbi:hypothetical protein BSK47_03585 [Paenibacillus odorifer]|uniref:ABC transporter domain-containing protein n=2 Tax=Paenibacillus TaxID=44249 RepID=A0AB36JHS2_9BACL|nr:hypothetical protein BSK47_03585 [Paenibacillus odorifer]
MCNGKMAYIEVKNVSKSYRVAKHNKKSSLQYLKFLLKKEYSDVEAVKNISFTLNKQDIVGYIGPNGAGKSTTIKILSGILRPDEGSCTVGGAVPWESRAEYVQGIGVLFGQRSQLVWDLPPIESFKLLSRLYKLKKEEYEASLHELVDLLELEELLYTPVRQLSLGQRVRCELAGTFLHNPKLVFLDEPTIGIDIEMKKKIHQFIKDINQRRKTTIFITTHDLDDIQSLCNRLIIINKGEIFFDDSLDNLFEKFFVGKKIHIDFANDEEIDIPKGTRILSKEGKKITILVESRDIQVSRLISEILQKHDVHDIYLEKNNIEDVILKIYLEMRGEKLQKR